MALDCVTETGGDFYILRLFDTRELARQMSKYVFSD